MLDQLFEINSAFLHMSTFFGRFAHLKHILNIETLVCTVKVQQQCLAHDQIPWILQIDLKFDILQGIFPVNLHLVVVEKLHKDEVVLVDEHMSHMHFLI